MKKPQALALLLATSLTVGAGSPLPLALAQEVSAQSMAEIYQPYFPPVDTRYLGSTQLESDKPLPGGTFIKISGMTRLEHCGWGADHNLENGVEFWTYGTTIEMQPAYPGREACDIDGPGHAWDETYWEGWEDVTYTANPTIIVHYPDGSRDTISADLRVRPSYTEYFEPTYDNRIEPKLEDLVVSPGGTYSVMIDPNPDPYRPDALVDFPEGTTFELDTNTKTWVNGEWVHIKPFEKGGGRLEVNPQTGEVTIELPENYQNKSSEAIRVNISYPDNSEYLPEGSSSHAMLWVKVDYAAPKPQPDLEPVSKNSSSPLSSSSS